MKKIYFSVLTAFLLFAVQSIVAQNTVTNQIMVCSGGNFSNPDDYVTVASFKPSNGLTNSFATVFTQSVQDVVVNGHFAFVAAQDSIVKFNIDTYERLAAVEAIGVHNLAVADDKLIASFWYPATENFVRSFSTDDLSQLGFVSEVSDEAAGILIYKNFAYVAVPGGWSSTGGKIAVIKLFGDIFIEEIDLGEDGVGVSDLFLYQANEDFLVSVNKSPWGVTVGHLSIMSLGDKQPSSFAFEASMGSGVELFGETLYLLLDGGIGSINIPQMAIADSLIIPNPGDGFVAAVLDTVNNLFYATTGDYVTTGEGTIYNMEAEVTGSFDAGIAAEALAIDYRDNTGFFEKSIVENLDVFPNPANYRISFNIPIEQTVSKTFILDISGRVVYSGNDHKQIDIGELNSGLYFITINTEVSIFTGKFIKN
ncbi:MAG: hypothetical protein DRI89_08265 [Bacteroidetes bacterium]|nr:MAG: hypothetical protein DRI89_08265 [Bacteroidota bacterium]